MANVEEGRVLDRVDLSVAARVTGIAAVVLGAAELLSWVTSFSMTAAAVAAIGDAFVWILHVLWIVKLVATAVVTAGLVVGWRQAPLLWTPGVGSVALGLVLVWGWWAVDTFTDVWGFDRFAGVDPSDPGYLWTLRASEWVDEAVAAVVIALLVSGGIRLLLRRHAPD